MMAGAKTKQEDQQVNKAVFKVVEVEDESVIVLAQGWRKRVYFDGAMKDQFKEGQMLEVEYTGDINDIHSVEFLKLKK
jgi:hypothetical protein